MKRKLITAELNDFPEDFRPLLSGAPVYDSSCSPEARVWFVDRGDGFYLKRSKKASLKKEAELTRFFNKKGLAAEVIDYKSLESDWLLTSRVPGEDCTHPLYLTDPKKLCDTMAELLRSLHEQDSDGCPVPNRTADFLETVEQNYRAGKFDPGFFTGFRPLTSADAAWRVVQEYSRHLTADTLLHGDYCLPNIMLDNWRFTGFIDLDSGGVGDRHIDIFWGAWTLNFNLGTDAYRSRFLDAYGRDAVTEELLYVIAAAEALS